METQTFNPHVTCQVCGELRPANTVFDWTCLPCLRKRLDAAEAVVKKVQQHVDAGETVTDGGVRNILGWMAYQDLAQALRAYRKTRGEK